MSNRVYRKQWIYFNNIFYCFKNNITKEFTNNIVEFDDIMNQMSRCFDSISSFSLFEQAIQYNKLSTKQRQHDSLIESFHNF